MATSELDEAALADLRHRYEPSVRTHWADCYKDHAFCAVVRLCDELTAARQRIAEVEGELSQDARIFAGYAGLHEAKGTPDGERKAAANREHAERIVALLAATPAAREGEATCE